MGYRRMGLFILIILGIIFLLTIIIIILKEIERLIAESTEWESKCYKYQDIINELEKEIELNLKFKVIGVKRLKDKLKELKGE